LKGWRKARAVGWRPRESLSLLSGIVFLIKTRCFPKSKYLDEEFVVKELLGCA
jgi:hypothetical protein